MRSTLLRRRSLLLLGVAALPSAPALAATGVTVWKDANCGCCEGWIRHLRQAGFSVEAHNAPDMATVKRSLGVPEHLWSCHTARVEGRLLEGHVPAADIRRLLALTSGPRGLAVPGMPASAPGMDMPGQPFDVIAFGAAAGDSVFAHH